MPVLIPVRSCKAAAASRKGKPRCRKAALLPRPHRPEGRLARCHIHGLTKPDWNQNLDMDWTYRDPPSVVDSDSDEELEEDLEYENGSRRNEFISRFNGGESSRTPSDRNAGSQRSRSTERQFHSTSSRRSRSRSMTPLRSTYIRSARTSSASSRSSSPSNFNRKLLQNRRSSYANLCVILGEATTRALFDCADDAIPIQEKTSECAQDSNDVLMQGVDSLLTTTSVHSQSIANLGMSLHNVTETLDGLGQAVRRLSVAEESHREYKI